MQTGSFSRNEQGRDFIIGDLHGMFFLLEQALQAVAFEPTRDRVFSVGNLIDPGAESWRLGEYLDYPWFHACQGYHESILVSYMAEPCPELLLLWLEEGGEWFFSLDESEQQRLAQAIEQKMYWAISVETDRGLVGVVHADVPAGCQWQDFVTDLPFEPYLQQLATCSRNRIRGLVCGPVGGVCRVFVGHTPLPAPCQLDNVCFINTGARLALEPEASDAALTLVQIQPDIRYCLFS